VCLRERKSSGEKEGAGQASASSGQPPTRHQNLPPPSSLLRRRCNISGEPLSFFPWQRRRNSRFRRWPAVPSASFRECTLSPGASRQGEHDGGGSMSLNAVVAELGHTDRFPVRFRQARNSFFLPCMLRSAHQRLPRQILFKVKLRRVSGMLRRNPNR
jgi:hypothetical protein